MLTTVHADAAGSAESFHRASRDVRALFVANTVSGFIFVLFVVQSCRVSEFLAKHSEQQSKGLERA